MSRRVITALAVAASLLVPTGAIATKSAARTGSFDAMGTGTLVLQGNLRAFGTIDGKVIVRDSAGGAIVRIGGVRQKPTRIIGSGDDAIRVYNLKRVDASFFVRGQGVRIELRSPETTLSMSAIGRGRVTVLSGQGTYHLNGGDELQWTSAIVPIKIAPPPPEPRAPSTTRSAEAGAAA